MRFSMRFRVLEKMNRMRQERLNLRMGDMILWMHLS